LSCHYQSAFKAEISGFAEALALAKRARVRNVKIRCINKTAGLGLATSEKSSMLRGGMDIFFTVNDP